MAYYLSRYVGSGTRQDPFRPALWETGVQRGSIDLRPDVTMLDGHALVRTMGDAPANARWLKVADDGAETLSRMARVAIYTHLGIAERSGSTRYADLMADLLLHPPPGGWHRLQPARGVHEIWLDGMLFWADGVPRLPATGTISDSFTRANETPIAAPWVELSGSTGDVNLTSNAITKVTDGDYFLSHNNDGNGWTADQSSSFLYATAIPSDDWGPAVRVGADGFSGYWWNQFGSPRNLTKFVAGSFSYVETASGATLGIGVVYKIDVAGSTIRYYDGGTENANSPVTDTSLTVAGSGAGAFWYAAGGTVDDAVLTGEEAGAAALEINVAECVSGIAIN